MYMKKPVYRLKLVTKETQNILRVLVHFFGSEMAGFNCILQDGSTDTPTYRDARKHLKISVCFPNYAHTILSISLKNVDFSKIC